MYPRQTLHRTKECYPSEPQYIRTERPTKPSRVRTETIQEPRCYTKNDIDNQKPIKQPLKGPPRDPILLPRHSRIQPTAIAAKLPSSPETYHPTSSRHQTYTQSQAPATKGNPREGVNKKKHRESRKMIEAMEEEITCPICMSVM